MQDHVHMLVSIPPKISVSSFMGYLKGKSSLISHGTACYVQASGCKKPGPFTDRVFPHIVTVGRHSPAARPVTGRLPPPRSFS